ncbi:MAG: TetR/AcrR family transcriptional regulator [Chloroflexaceae bacterium]|nr:TetR/AcrR family transcriptional regulator [Chloroflexaceae bacterium]
MARPKTNHEEKKARIIQAAMAVFAHHGYEGTTNKLIAAEVRRRTSETFSPALIYHYFPDGKPQLLATVMQQYQPLQALGQAVREASDAPRRMFCARWRGTTFASSASQKRRSCCVSCSLRGHATRS